MDKTISLSKTPPPPKKKKKCHKTHQEIKQNSKSIKKNIWLNSHIVTAPQQNN